MARAGKPRLLVLASTYPRWPGDPEPAFVHELARRLVDRYDVRVLCPHAPGAPEAETLDGVDVVRFRYAPARWETLVNDGGIVANLKRSRWKWLLVPVFGLALAWHARRQLSAWRPDAVHAHWLVPQAVALLAGESFLRRKVPLLATAHGADLYALRGRLFDALRRRVGRRAARVTVVSEAMRAPLVAQGVPAERIAVASMGVDLRGRFTPDAAIARHDRELLFVGRLVEKKGLPVLLDALPDVLRAFPDARLSIAGFGPDAPALRAQCTRLGLDARVDFLGPVAQADLPALYRRATVFVAPFVQAASGDQEGLGLVSIEAAGCGCPVVISDLPATRDAFAERVPPGSAPALAVALVALLAATPDARAAHAAAQRARLLDRYDWSAVARTYGDLLDAIATSPGPA